MKKSLLTIALVTIFGLGVMAQDTIVSTVPTNKNVVLEEYTGVNCGYCPDGHRIANDIAEAHPGRVCLINIHQGNFAANTYTTQWGNALANQYNITSYPNGTVNRGSSALNPGQWTSASNTVLNQTSPVNIGAEGTLDWSTGELSLHIQLYYTGTTTATNMLNVAVLQNNVLGSQSGMSSNPSQVEGNQYRHMHMLRDLITGQWGAEITNTSVGTLFDTIINYTIPAQLGSPTPIATAIENMDFVVFVAEGNKGILTGIHPTITNTNLPEIYTRVDKVEEVVVNTCDETADAQLVITNLGSVAITSMEISYKVGNADYQTYNWTGNIPSLSVDTVVMPEFEVTPGVETTYKAIAVKTNGTELQGQTEKSVKIKKEVYQGTMEMTLSLTCDAYGSETTWALFDENDVVVTEGGPYQDYQSSGTHPHTIPLTLPSAGCYRLEVYDAYGDGINAGYGAGSIKVYDNNFNIIFTNNGKFGSMGRWFFSVNGVGVEENTVSANIYPNPASSMLNIDCEGVTMVQMFNLAGQEVLSFEGEVNVLNIEDLANGIYVLKVSTKNGSYIQKIVKE